MRGARQPCTASLTLPRRRQHWYTNCNPTVLVDPPDEVLLRRQTDRPESATTNQSDQIVAGSLKGLVAALISHEFPGLTTRSPSTNRRCRYLCMALIVRLWAAPQDRHRAAGASANAVADMEFTRAFLMTLRTFTMPSQLFGAIVERCVRPAAEPRGHTDGVAGGAAAGSGRLAEPSSVHALVRVCALIAFGSRRQSG